MIEDKIWDCAIVGAGPGGLQAAIYLGRYNRNVLILDRSGGRTRHARHVENYLGHPLISGRDLIRIGIEQAEGFNVKLEKASVTGIVKDRHFKIFTEDGRKFLSSFVVVSSGVRDNLLPIENLQKFFGTSFFTCVDCDGYRTVGKKVLIIGNTLSSVRLAFAVKEMYTPSVTLLSIFYEPPADYTEELEREGILLKKGRPKKILGEDRMEALELEDGRRIECEAILSDFGYKLNDKFLKELLLDRDVRGFKYVTDRHFESSTSGLFIVGPLNVGPDQAVVAAGQGATAAIEIKKRLLEI